MASVPTEMLEAVPAPPKIKLQALVASRVFRSNNCPSQPNMSRC
jgi:hypothetical protein